MNDELENLEKLRDRVKNQKGTRALASPLYFIVQQLAVIISLNLVFPALLNLTWQGSYLEQALFIFVYAIVYSIAGMLFLAVGAFIAIMFESFKSLNDIKSGKISPTAASHNIPYKVMTGSNPKWLIAIAPPLVPMISFSFLTIFFAKCLVIPDTIFLLKACAIQGVISYVVSLPFVLQAQKGFHEALESKEVNSEEKD